MSFVVKRDSMILDTSVVIDKVKGEEIFDGISVITILEYPPIEEYRHFYGNIIGLKEEIIFLARDIQKS